MNKLSIGLSEIIEEWNAPVSYVEVRTSGSTGKPKNIRIPKTTIVASCQNTISYFGLKRLDSFFLCLPLASIGGRMVVYRSIVIGGKLISHEPSSRPLQYLKEYVRIASMSPHQMMESIILDADKLDLVDIFLLGGATVSQELEELIKYHNLNAYESYGMTETVSHIALRDIKKQNYFSVLNGIELKSDEDNCLIIHSDFLPHGPVISNDIVQLIDSKSFVWKGRRDLMINTGGIKVNPYEIEEKIKSVVNSAYFVHGLEDSVFGQKIVLIIKKEDNSKNDDDLIRNRLKILLDNKLVPKEIYLIDKFEYTLTGKLDRKKTTKRINMTHVC